MTTFTPFQPLIGEIKSDEHLKKYADFETIVTEKIHGCNFSIYITKQGEVTFASRQRMLDDKSKLFNYRSYFTKEKCRSLSDIAKNNPNVFGTSNILRIVGELFGPKIQKMPYRSGVDFNVFFVELDNIPLNWADQDENTVTVTVVAEIFNLNLVPLVAIGPLKEMYSMDIGLSQLTVKPCTCEGYCYRISNVVDDEGIPIILKKRNEIFLETAYCGNFPEARIQASITRQRANNILSKGFEGHMDMERLSSLMWKDIADEFDSIPKEVLDKVQKTHVSKMMQIVSAELNEELNKERIDEKK